MNTHQNKKNVFVVGLDDFNESKLKTIRGAGECNFLPLLHQNDLQGRDAYPVDVALKKCDEELSRFPGTIDGIIGYWDFPVTDMVPLLCRKYKRPAAPFESVLKCEHKYWSRMEEKKVVPEHIPPFRAVDPFDDASIADIDLKYPFWLKPVKATDSELAFRIKNRRALREAIPIIRERIHRFSEPFNYLMQFADLPDNVEWVDGRHCIAEGTISGRQCTVEGYVHKGKVHTHGVIDSFRYPGVSSFFRYQYPSRLPERMKEKITRISETVIEQLGLNNSTWNIEFFVSPNQDEAWLLEVNPRISQSHAHMFDLVDGTSNLEIMVALALGEKPSFPHRQGRFKCASKFYVRVFENAFVARIPTQNEIERIQEKFPGTLIQVTAREGEWLSDLVGQDAYSYRIAQIHMGANNTRELLEKFRACRDLLPFEFSAEQPDLAPLGGKSVEELAQDWR